ncbi:MULTISPECIES: phosphodiester glycosidase family protein [Paenibacillus]|uniref:phosphodiester glycosidase family protein n=1 Tax=Paenibacillus TaxID=44249 RepID=UPI0022B9259F|nr:phosphodiester glycosidase family protein [Paenibacillus caseinilyticus]MCZ8518102.1 phosphodiester glycosidase family protein [Paenibacillus caseinilyticus]
MSLPLSEPSGRSPARSSSASKPIKRIRRSSSRLTLFFYTLSLLFLFGSMGTLWFFLTASGTQMRMLMADTLITTQHRHWAQYLIGPEELDKRVNRYMAQFDHYSEVEDKGMVHVGTDETVSPEVEDQPPISIEEISGTNFKGKLLIVRDPKKLRIAVPGTKGKGEKVSSMVQRLDAIAGVNAGGFVDPEWKGNGFQPTGLVISGGQIFYNDGGMNASNHIVGIDKDGRMIAGKYTANQLMEMNVREAVTFAPRFIVNGVGQIRNQGDGWGIAPRTAMAQKEDGTILFAIIDGRQPGHSIGASLYDIQQIFLEHGAVTAANLDGGSSTVLVVNPKHNGTAGSASGDTTAAAGGTKGKPGDAALKPLNKPSSEYGERYLPTAWLVFDDPEQAGIRNIWEGMDPRKIDASKW